MVVITTDSVVLCFLLAAGIMQRVQGSSQIAVTQHPKDQTLKKGTDAKLVCTFNTVVFCNWERQGETVLVHQHSPNDKQRYQFLTNVTNPNASRDCSMRIISVQEIDRAHWYCTNLADDNNDAVESRAAALIIDDKRPEALPPPEALPDGGERYLAIVFGAIIGAILLVSLLVFGVIMWLYRSNKWIFANDKKMEKQNGNGIHRNGDLGVDPGIQPERPRPSPYEQIQGSPDSTRLTNDGYLVPNHNHLPLPNRPEHVITQDSPPYANKFKEPHVYQEVR